MGESSIGWLHPPSHGRAIPWGEEGSPGYTVNAWIGCTRYAPECENCYAERRAGRRLLPSQKDRSLPVWGPKAARHMTALATLRKVKGWNREAEAAGWYRLVFGGSQMDWLEDRADLAERRELLLDLIEATPSLRWIMLTKRPENFGRLVPRWREGCPRNVWVGISAGCQRSLDKQLGAFDDIPAALKLISAEPLIEPTDYSRALRIARWIIFGGESGPGARPCSLGWIRAGLRQATEAGRHRFVKQLGSRPLGVPPCIGCENGMFEGDICGRCGDEVELVQMPGGEYGRRLHLKHHKGEDPLEWPLDLRIQEWPDGSAYLFNHARTA